MRIPLLSSFWRTYKQKSFYKAFLEKGQLCFDIGANHGQKTKIFLRLGAQVIAVEPNPECVIALKKRFNANKSLHLLALGVSEKSGPKVFYPGKNNEISTFSTSFIDYFKKYEYNQWLNPITVNTTTLEELIAQWGLPHFCKIDVEGYELQALQGLHQAIPIIEFEFTAPFLPQTKKCVEHLASLGNVEFNYSPYERYCLALKTWQTPQAFLQTLDSFPADLLHGNIFARFTSK